MNTATAEKKPRLTTSAMIASIASEGQKVVAAPFGKALVELAAQRPEIVGLSADLSKYTDMHLFAQAYPERFFQMGMALALRHKQSKAFVYNSMSDGELDEGSTWEAAMSAAHHGLSNLICLVDINNQQADGPSTKILGFEPLADKWAAFGWHVQRVDGNDMAAVWAAFDTARTLAEAKPRVILFNTLMGKGVPFLETRDKNHFIRVDPPEWQKALQILDDAQAQGAAA